jgi:NADH:ubiquinone oxidoreductase subunit B-like Fe-S oxidoreductase
MAPQPCLVVAIGECSLSRGLFIHSYNCPLPLDKIIPVHAYIPGCPPKPEAIIMGAVKLIQKVKGKL